MPRPAPRSIPQLVSLRTIAAERGATFDWHSHPFDEFTLVTDDPCLIGYPPGWRDTAPGTLLHYRAGERHGAWTSPDHRPRFWVVHFTRGAGDCAGLDFFAETSSERRVLSLAPEQNDTFQWIFLQLLNEHTAPRQHRDIAASAWLQLLLVTVQRWASSHEATITLPSSANAGVLRLWHRINASVGKPAEELNELYSTPNYDSLRHAFRKAFGCSPRVMLQRLRMEHAKNLLLESALSIKEISARLGYATQHDFNRMFHRQTGMAPTKWRSNPFARGEADKRW
jgi:hypothetical protein